MSKIKDLYAVENEIGDLVPTELCVEQRVEAMMMDGLTLAEATERVAEQEVDKEIIEDHIDMSDDEYARRITEKAYELAEACAYLDDDTDKYAKYDELDRRGYC